MPNRTHRVTVRFRELEYARFMSTLGFNNAWDTSRALRQAVRLWCEHVEAERKRKAEEAAAPTKKPPAKKKPGDKCAFEFCPTNAKKR